MVMTLREEWEKNRLPSLKLSEIPQCDVTDAGELKSELDRFAATQERLKDLARVMSLLHEIYIRDQSRPKGKRIYSESFLGFVGNSVVRSWPNKDFPFMSSSAHDVVSGIVGHSASPAGTPQLLELKGKGGLVHYEHWTPISFFRDIFRLRAEQLTAGEVHEALCHNYRVVWITKDEQSRLNEAGYHSWRPADAYRIVGINIHQAELWTMGYGGANC